jgi:hypothetical protein
MAPFSATPKGNATTLLGDSSICRKCKSDKLRGKLRFPTSRPGATGPRPVDPCFPRSTRVPAAALRDGPAARAADARDHQLFYKTARFSTVGRVMQRDENVSIYGPPALAIARTRVIAQRNLWICIFRCLVIRTHPHSRHHPARRQYRRPVAPPPLASSTREWARERATVIDDEPSKLEDKRTKIRPPRPSLVTTRGNEHT